MKVSKESTLTNLKSRDPYALYNLRNITTPGCDSLSASLRYCNEIPPSVFSRRRNMMCDLRLLSVYLDENNIYYIKHIVFPNRNYDISLMLLFFLLSFSEPLLLLTLLLTFSAVFTNDVSLSKRYSVKRHL